jgi:hypothetical protein
MVNVINQKAFNEFKEEYYNWSGFEIEYNNLEEIKKEIQSTKWKLECEISEQADKLEQMVSNCFDEEDNK